MCKRAVSPAPAAARRAKAPTPAKPAPAPAGGRCPHCNDPLAVVTLDGTAYPLCPWCVRYGPAEAVLPGDPGPAERLYGRSAKRLAERLAEALHATDTILADFLALYAPNPRSRPEPDDNAAVAARDWEWARRMVEWVRESVCTSAGCGRVDLPDAEPAQPAGLTAPFAPPPKCRCLCDRHWVLDGGRFVPVCLYCVRYNAAPWDEFTAGLFDARRGGRSERELVARLTDLIRSAENVTGDYVGQHVGGVTARNVGGKPNEALKDVLYVRGLILHLVAHTGNLDGWDGLSDREPTTPPPARTALARAGSDG